MRGKVEVTEFTEAGAEWPISALLLIQKNEKKLEQESRAYSLERKLTRWAL